jgi:hypothetical protein
MATELEPLPAPDQLVVKIEAGKTSGFDGVVYYFEVHTRDNVQLLQSKIGWVRESNAEAQGARWVLDYSHADERGRRRMLGWRTR